MTELYKDYIPANARVVVDYTKDKKVEFTYPREYTYKQAVWKCAYMSVLGFWIQILVTILYTIIIPICLIYQIITLDFSTTPITTTQLTLYDIFMALTPVLIIIYIILGIPAIITWYLSLDKDRVGKYAPKLSFWATKLLGVSREKTFTPEDVSDNKVIVPFFKNVYLDYQTIGDFSNIEKIEVKEISVKGLTKNIWLWFKNIKKWKIKHNEYDWHCVFTFKETPKTGNMVVHYI